MRIAVVGSGISGSLAARLLHSHHDVTLFESSTHAGGHSNTVTVKLEGRSIDVDTGFMVFNDRTYPNFCRLLHLLRVESQPSDMSFSVRCDRTELEYQGSSLNGLFAQRSNLLRPTFYQLLADIIRFNSLGTKAVVKNLLHDRMTVGDFITEHSLKGRFLTEYLIPMTAAIWSGRPDTITSYPARFLLTFCHNHGLMQIRNRPKWQTIIGGSKEYVQRLLAPLKSRVRLNTAVEKVRREKHGVELQTPDGIELFDHVILATHADQSLKILQDASERERAVLGKFPYQANLAVLHTDTRQLPKLSRAWASWNYRITAEHESSATVTYDLNRLQRLGLSRPLLLTLNPIEVIPPHHVIQTFRYHHPAYTLDSCSAQRMHSSISGLKYRTHFCGAYWGYGFHEDGVNSALTVTREFGIGLESCIVASTKAPLRTAVSCR